MTKLNRLSWQSAFWLFITASFIWIPEWGRMPPYEVYRTIAMLIVKIAIVFCVIYGLFPKYFEKGKKVTFVFLSFFLLIALALLVNQLFPQRLIPIIKHLGINPNQPPGGTSFFIKWFASIFPLFVTMAVAAFWEIWVQLQSKEKENIQLAGERADTELKFLKSQINPHFLLNALNNIYSLSVMQSPQTSESIMRLSELMRYVLYECNSGKVPLSKEIKYIEDYLAIYQLKKQHALNIQMTFIPFRPDTYIHPMILIPFVENAIKHGDLEYNKNAFIAIEVGGDSDKIKFTLRNSLSPGKSSKDNVSGIGLQNVRKRLDLLYSTEYVLKINDENGTFKVSLELPYD